MTELLCQEMTAAWCSCPGSQIESQRLRLRYVWVNDRFRLEIYRDFRETGEIFRSELLLTSLEGTAADRWPASAPLQSLAMESRGQRSVALAVGMAGKAHWSASVETLDDPSAIRFDYACRLTESPQFLGSTFQLQTAGKAVECIAVEDVTDGEVRLQDSEIQIVAAPPIPANSVWTARWRFTLRVLA